MLRLDGGLATELQRAGLPMRAPWWTTRALLTEQGRTLLRGVHERYLAAGAQIITANTFRCNLRALVRAAALDTLAGDPSWLVQAAVGAAQAARTAMSGAGGCDGGVLVAASMAPVADCYRPDLVPPDDELRVEHRWLATSLVRAGADFVLIETMNSAREARIALEQVQAVGGRAWVSFVCQDGEHLLSGEPLSGAARAALADGAQAVLVNCTPLEHTQRCLEVLRASCAGTIGAYPNVEDRSGVAEWTHVDRVFPTAASPPEFAEIAYRWHAEYGVSVLGGCCGSTPAHIAALSQLSSPARE
jgi:enediyne biosynthesis protein CalE2